MYLILGNRIVGIVSVTDKIKKTSAKAIHYLQKMDVKEIMFTGDNEFSAKSVAAELHLDDFKADCLPDYKYNKAK